MAKQNMKKASSSNTDQKSVELTEIEQELTTVNPEIFHGVNQKKKEEILRSISITMVQERTHSGPLPDPESLVRYNSVITEGANRIMKMAEKQQEHRMALETKIITNQTKQSVLGAMVWTDNRNSRNRVWYIFGICRRINCWRNYCWGNGS